jgi:hypothetical protein
LKTLVITNREMENGQKSALRGLNIHLINWFQARDIRASDYEVALIDTRLPFRKEKLEGLFLEMRVNVEELLSAGGVVFVLAGPTEALRTWRNSRGDLHTETNYDLIPEPLLGLTKLSESLSKTGSRYEVAEKWKEYALYAPNYWKIIDGITDEEEIGPVIRYSDANGFLNTAPVHPIALTQATAQAVGCLISWQGGTLGIIPAPERMYEALILLNDRALEIYKENIEEVREYLKPPSWISLYETKEQKDLESKEHELLAEIQQVKKKIGELFLPCSVLYSTGKPLQRATLKVLSDFGWEIDDVTKKGDPIDYVVRTKNSSDTLLIALTGTNGYIDANHRKLAQLFGALLKVHEHEHLVFLANALAETDPNSRIPEKCITNEALNRMREHGICVLLIPDLYKLWVDWLEGRISAEKIFQMLSNTSGLFKYS